MSRPGNAGLTASPLYFDWYKLAPSDGINWTPCFDVQLCARLDPPLDYSRPDGPSTQITLRMISATDKANYQGMQQSGSSVCALDAGTVFVNAGGPGVFTDGAKLVGIFGPTFDILGFDPRGVGATTPLAQSDDVYHY